MALKIAYWDIRGLIQPVKLLLAHVGAEYENIEYSCGPAPEFSRDSWMSVKDTLGLDFPNLPYLIDGDVKLTQSNAILRYLARKFGLEGETEEERVRIDLMAEEAMDFRNAVVRLSYNPNFEHLKDAHINEYLPKLFTGLEKFLGERPFFAGQKISFPDFVLYELLDQNKCMEPTVLDNFPKLQAFTQRIEALPNIAAYMSSDRFRKSPINNKMAAFGAQ
eukprot:TRINITY_DN155_c0_g1_i1.p1 TRINITY_DN155_c0_g1~~TRINITY_DN155_c0_g1_i1.p1  ORF type:complete len:240 (-),score=105.75 TRINITY_DN155_c0_g1_i1:30-689(-)